jgi:hypothetical protein
MRKLLFVPLILLLFSGCKKDENNPYAYTNDGSIYSETNSTTCKTLLLFIKLKTADGYVVTDSLDSLKIMVNGKFWTLCSSEKIDTAGRTDTTVSNYNLSHDPVIYPVVANYFGIDTEPQTAGDFSNILNNFYSLMPGDYYCEISKLCFHKNNAAMVTTTPYIYREFNVAQNEANSFVGEFEITLNY